MNPTQRPALTRYGVAILAVFTALFLLALPRIGEALGSVLFLAVLVSAWYGGMGPSLLATGLITSSALVVMLQRHALTPSSAVRLGLFTSGALLITALVEALHSARRRAEWAGEEARRQEEVLRLSEEALKEADRRKDEFLAVLAHELRNPLAAIRNAAQLIQVKEGGEDLRWGTEVIERQSAQLGSLIDDLMDVSRVSQGKVLLRREPLDLRALVLQAVEDVRPASDERRHRLTVSLPPEPLPLSADATRVRQIAVNLLTNAVKYTEPGGRIELTARRDGDQHVLAVRDSGVGIAPEMLERVFELYAQADRTLASAQGGLGIGLTLVRRLAELHGGSVSAHSDGPGRGSMFTVRLPASDVPPATRNGRPSPPGAACERPLRVLVVDRRDDSARCMARLLEGSGHDVLVARDGIAALDSARSRRPDAVLLDIDDPGEDDYRLARTIRGDGSLAGVSLIAISGGGREQDLRRCREAGIDHHLVKPVDVDGLLALLAEVRGGGDGVGNGGPQFGQTLRALGAAG
jgi:signal transduction histidine kinase/ActR/RegA family two-component response regulator